MYKRQGGVYSGGQHWGRKTLPGYEGLGLRALVALLPGGGGAGSLRPGDGLRPLLHIGGLGDVHWIGLPF